MSFKSPEEGVRDYLLKHLSSLTHESADTAYTSSSSLNVGGENALQVLVQCLLSPPEPDKLKQPECIDKEDETSVYDFRRVQLLIESFAAHGNYLFILQLLSTSLREALKNPSFWESSCSCCDGSILYEILLLSAVVEDETSVECGSNDKDLCISEFAELYLLLSFGPWAASGICQERTDQQPNSLASHKSTAGNSHFLLRKQLYMYLNDLADALQIRIEESKEKVDVPNLGAASDSVPVNSCETHPNGHVGIAMNPPSSNWTPKDYRKALRVVLTDFFSHYCLNPIAQNASSPLKEAAPSTKESISSAPEELASETEIERKTSRITGFDSSSWRTKRYKKEQDPVESVLTPKPTISSASSVAAKEASPDLFSIFSHTDTPTKNNSPFSRRTVSSRRHSFTQEEDNAILKGIENVHFIRPSTFKDVFESFKDTWRPTRTPTQLYDHWRQCLRHRLEEERIVE